LFLALGVTLTDPTRASPAGGPSSLREAGDIVARTHDQNAVNWIRPMGGAMRARLNDGGEMRVMTVTRDGLAPTSRNWPRLLHEGNWGGALSAGINVVISLALIALMSTGLILWGRRKLRRRAKSAAA
jgi:uncharacterized iron-regulated membrane protein